MNPIENILNTNALIILDGALATELEKRGCDINDTLWSAKILAENPNKIQKVHYDYFVAGADCVITSSYQATIEGFVNRGYSEDEAIKLIQKSVEIAKKARDDFWKQAKHSENRLYPLVAASVGPYGAFLADGSEYRGDYKLTEKELMDFHRPRIKALIEAKPDILACETIPSIVEARAIANLLKEFPGVYAWVSFSAKNDLQISDGSLISDCGNLLENFDNIAAIGVNCTPPQFIPSLLRELVKNTTKPVVVYPNSGETYDPEAKEWYGESSSDGFACNAKQWFNQGAKLIGGCCRTSPEDIKGIADWKRKL